MMTVVQGPDVAHPSCIHAIEHSRDNGMQEIRSRLCRGQQTAVDVCSLAVAGENIGVNCILLLSGVKHTNY
jgi:hypothetical protein